MRNKGLWWVLCVFFLHKRVVSVAVIHSSTTISRQECLNKELYAFWHLLGPAESGAFFLDNLIHQSKIKCNSVEPFANLLGEYHKLMTEMHVDKKPFKRQGTKEKHIGMKKYHLKITSRTVNKCHHNNLAAFVFIFHINIFSIFAKSQQTVF